MRHGSLFSGIGGFDLAAEWMGWENVFHCEWNPFGQKVLKHYWPNAISYDDITKTDFTLHRGGIDVLTGGFPCQPYSVAGQRKGKEDERHLWPEMLRAIREIEPTWVVGENVRGLLNWNGGMVFEEVCTDLETLGYQVTPYLIPACAVNAPHKRERIWFVAYCDRTPTKHKNGNASDTDSRNYKTRSQRQVLDQSNREKARRFRNVECTNQWQNFPTQPPVCTGDDGLSSRLDGITFSKWRNESIKAAGNAVVPQIPYLIFKTIESI